MTTLQPDEIELIAMILQKPPRCPARNYSNKILAGPSPEDLLDIQIFLNAAADELCREIWSLKRLEEDYRIRRRERDRRQRDPTTQERDRKNAINRRKGLL